MKISRANQFADGRVIRLNSEEQILLRKKIDWKPQDSDRRHTVSLGDTLDQIAYRYYKDKVADPEAYWWLIADANGIFNPFDLPLMVGVQLLIPDVLLLDFQR